MSFKGKKPPILYLLEQHVKHKNREILKIKD